VKNALAGNARARAAFDLKGLSTSLTVLRLRTKDLSLVDRQLRIKVTQFPQFFQDAPVLVDLGGVEDGHDGLSLPMLVRVLRACRVVPVAAVNVPEELREAAVSAGLGVLGGPPRGREGRHEDGDAERVAPVSVMPESQGPSQVLQAIAPGVSPAQGAHGGAGAPHAQSGQHAQPGPTGPAQVVVRSRLPVVVRQPVRSGQVIYAEQTDLIVLAPVNPGAQLVADGNIHVYAPLRGRALAGAHGFADARIFCQRLEAELVSIGDAYFMADDIPEARWGRPTQIFLDGGECRLLPL
jgi:septum site-determining protein MinC